ncbi:sigma-70 family RNA polymerase sigma factor [Actinoplanes sp. NPDC049596]|uniref:RNA polymerase sigma factor n=1 Tax=unclassified Actinoplanes TaxID=2626549 RepID=UPI003434E2F8
MTESEAAFRELFAAAYDDLLVFVERRTDLAEADDVVAETFLVAWRRLRDVPEPPDEARAWLFTVAHNILRNQRRSLQRQRQVALRVLREPDDDRDVTDADAVADRIDLARAWQRLSPADQEVLTLTALEELTGPQAARVLNISRTAFSLRLVRARRRLRNHLRHSPDPGSTARPSPVRTALPGGPE